MEKGKSPFYPGQPVPAEFFVGREQQIRFILERGAAQVAEGKPIAIFVEGEFGIGKSSIAGFTQYVAEKQNGLLPVYVSLGGSKTVDEVVARTVESAIRSGAADPLRLEKLGNWVAKYIGEQTLYGVTVRLDALRADAPALRAGLLQYLGELVERLRETGVRGVFVVLDEIDGIASNSDFAHFIKGLVDTNALSKSPVPLLLMLCGVEERRRQMIGSHQPIDRIFDIVAITRLPEENVRTFFKTAFASVGIEVDDGALDWMVYASAGEPKIMHLMGDAAFWKDSDQRITKSEAVRASLDAAEEVGKRYVDQQVYKTLKSDAYRAILRKVGVHGNFDTFERAGILLQLDTGEREKFDNFVRKMKDLNVIRSGLKAGEYLFNSRMVGMYIWLEGLGDQPTQAYSSTDPGHTSAPAKREE